MSTSWPRQCRTMPAGRLLFATIRSSVFASAFAPACLQTPEEERKLNTECRGFLHYLEQAGILDCTARELIIDRVLALESDDLDIGQVKWIILMVLFNQPGQEQAFVWMEDLVMDDLCHNLH